MKPTKWKKIPGQRFESGICSEMYRRRNANGKLEDALAPYEMIEINSRDQPIPVPKTKPPTT